MKDALSDREISELAMRRLTEAKKVPPRDRFNKLVENRVIDVDGRVPKQAEGRLDDVNPHPSDH